MATSVKNNFLPPSLISNLQQVLISRNDSGKDDKAKTEAGSCTRSLLPASCQSALEESNAEKDDQKPVVLVTNGDGIESPGLTALVEALVGDGRFNVQVCAPQSDRSMSGHSLTIKETVTASSLDINGAAAFEVSGTPADCVSLALSGALFSWSSPVLVISGINMGSGTGHNVFHSGAVAAAREALMCGVPSLCISLNWKKEMSCENDLKDAATVCLPLLYAAVRDIKKGNFPSSCFMSIEIPTRPLSHKGFKVTRKYTWRPFLSWTEVSATNRHPSAASHFMSNQQCLGIKLAQLSRDASAAGAARRLNSHRRNVEIESVGVAGKTHPQQSVKKYFRSEFSEKEQENEEDDADCRAIEDGFVSVTPFPLHDKSEIQALVANWIAAALATEK